MPSKASEWAARLDPVLADRPRIKFVAPDSGYIVHAYIAIKDSSREPVFTIDSPEFSQPPTLRAENAIALARWILDTFGEAQP